MDNHLFKIGREAAKRKGVIEGRANGTKNISKDVENTSDGLEIVILLNNSVKSCSEMGRK